MIWSGVTSGSVSDWSLRVMEGEVEPGDAVTIAGEDRMGDNIGDDDPGAGLFDDSPSVDSDAAASNVIDGVNADEGEASVLFTVLFEVAAISLSVCCNDDSSVRA